jgi:hypothetical protein
MPSKVLLIILGLSVLLYLPSYINGCGMLVHMDVTDRALHGFGSNSSYPYAEAFRKHRSYVLAGSPFPDWGYLCGSSGGEAAHWPPFIEAY